MTIPKNLGEVKENNLDGYKLTDAYFLELSHNLWGTFPVLISNEKTFFVCVDLTILERVWELLPKKRSKVTKTNFYANIEKNIGFCVSNGDSAEPLHILSEEEFLNLTTSGGIVEDEVLFEWAEGLLSLENDSKMESPFKKAS